MPITITDSNGDVRSTNWPPADELDAVMLDKTADAKRKSAQDIYDAEKAARQEVFKIVKRKIDFAQRQKSTNMMSKATRKKSKKRSFFFFWRKKKKSKASTASSFSKKKSEKGDIKHIVYASPRNEQEKEIFILKDFL